MVDVPREGEFEADLVLYWQSRARRAEHDLKKTELACDLKLKEMAEHWDLRTKVLRKQLDKVMELATQRYSLTPSPMFIEKDSTNEKT